MGAALAEIIHLAADAATIISGFIAAEEALHQRKKVHKVTQTKSRAKHQGQVHPPTAQLPVFNPARSSPELAHGMA